MIRQIVLHGNLKGLAPDHDIRFDCDTVAEAIRACSYQINGFMDTVKAGSYRVCLYEDKPENEIDETLLHFNLGDTISQIHIIPVIEGSKGGGGKIIIGSLLIATAFFTGGLSLVGGGVGFTTGAGGAALAGIYGGVTISAAALTKLGVALVLGGVSQLLSPDVDTPDAQEFERPDARPSFLFNGPVNTTEQGGPVPLVYGRVITGSHVVSSGLTTEDI